MVPAIYSFPHGLFSSAEELADYLREILVDRDGRYRVVNTSHYGRPESGDIVVFQKYHQFVGKARIKEGLRRYKRPKLINGVEYQGYLSFDPNTVRLYKKRTTFAEVEKKIGHESEPAGGTTNRLEGVQSHLGRNMTHDDPIGQGDSKDEKHETPAAPVPPASRDDKPLVMGALMIGGGTVTLIALLVLGAFSLFNGGSARHTLSGSIVLSDSNFSGISGGGSGGISILTVGDKCSGTGGYSDMDAGTQVVAKDGDGTVIGTSQLQAGKSVSKFGGGNFGYASCEFDFLVPELPESEFYSVEVSHRGAITYSLQELKDKNWTLSMSLGK